MILRGSDTLKGQNIREFRVCDDDADGLGRVHGRAAADGDNGISAGSLEGSHPVLDILDRGVGLDLGVDAVSDARLVEKVRDFCRDTELDEVGIGADEDLREALTLSDAGNLLYGPLAMVGYGVQYDSVCHVFSFPPLHESFEIRTDLSVRPGGCFSPAH